jgi:hypothetical protein
MERQVSQVTDAMGRLEESAMGQAQVAWQEGSSGFECKGIPSEQDSVRSS